MLFLLQIKNFSKDLLDLFSDFKAAIETERTMKLLVGISGIQVVSTHWFSTVYSENGRV